MTLENEKYLEIEKKTEIHQGETQARIIKKKIANLNTRSAMTCECGRKMIQDEHAIVL